MIAATIFFGGFVATFVCISVFFLVFMAHGAKYKELSDPDYPRLTMGNPLTALFIERLLTHEGLRFRSIFCKALLGIWVVVLIAGVLASSLG